MYSEIPSTPRTPEQYAGLINGLMPTGDAWPTDPGSVQQQAIRALAAGFADLDARAVTLTEDAFPPTSVGLLPDWELSVGLPDPCAGPQPTVVQRQRGVTVALTALGGQSIPYFVGVAAALGATITVEEFVPFRVGGTVGRPLNGEAWAHTWRVDAPALEVETFQVGSSRVGEPLRTWGSSVLECTLKRFEPAHTVLLFAYVGPAAGAALGSFVLGRDSLA